MPASRQAPGGEPDGVRLQLGKKLEKQIRRRRPDAETVQRAKEKLALFKRDPTRRSLKLEPLRGSQDLWKIRVTRGRWRILLRKAEDDEGVYWIAVRIISHDDY